MEETFRKMKSPDNVKTQIAVFVIVSAIFFAIQIRPV